MNFLAFFIGIEFYSTPTSFKYQSKLLSNYSQKWWHPIIPIYDFHQEVASSFHLAVVLSIIFKQRTNDQIDFKRYQSHSKKQLNICSSLPLSSKQYSEMKKVPSQGGKFQRGSSYSISFQIFCFPFQIMLFISGRRDFKSAFFDCPITTITSKAIIIIFMTIGFKLNNIIKLLNFKSLNMFIIMPLEKLKLQQNQIKPNQHNQIDQMKQTQGKIKHTQDVDDQELIFDAVEPIEMIYNRINVLANIKVEKEIEGKLQEVPDTKMILKECSGKFTPNTFTAILGPSGCGKTTMLNLISGRQLSDNLQLRGELKINGNEVSNISKYKSYIGYVMQQDFMLPTFTPQQAFRFVTDLRLSHLTDDQKDRVVKMIIKNLGLQKCQDTWVGDTRIRGVSGGERKRTSIGLQLLINPSILFLDEPTTGLDSTTSLNLIRFLNKLAKQGRTVISTIHQPSSEIFAEFDHIILMVDGHIVYDGLACDSISYFSGINLAVPKHTNPTDHYMKLMNKEGIMLSYLERKMDYTDEQINVEFKERVEYLVRSYKSQGKRQITNEVTHKLEDISQKFESSWCTQFMVTLKRSWVNQFRQPLDVILKVVQSIFFGVLCIILYEQEGTTVYEVIQNNQGVIFFLVMNIGFGLVFASVNLFNFERPVFIRERLSNTYSTSAYYLARTLAVLPIEFMMVFLLLAIAYFPVNLDNSASVFFKSLLSLALTGYMSSSYGLLLSAAIPDAGLVMALVPILIIPFLLVGGFFVPLSTVFEIYYPFQYLSMFRYGFQAMIYSQYQGSTITVNGQSITPLETQYNFQIPFWLDLMLLAIIGTIIRIIAFIVMYLISNPKIMPLMPPKEMIMDQGDNQITLKMNDVTHSKVRND